MKNLGWKIALAFAAIYLIWGSTFLATRFAVMTIPSFFVAGIRFFVAGVVLFLIGRMRHREKLTWQNWRAATCMGALFFLICHGGVSWAARHVPSGISALLMSSISLWTGLIEWIRRSETRPNKLVGISLAVGFLGIATLVVRPEVLAGSQVGSLGALVVVVGAFSWSLGTVFARKVDLPSSVVVSSGMQMICGGGLLLLAGTLSGQAASLSLAALTPTAMTSMLFLTLIGSLVGFTCYIWLLGVVSPTLVATYAYVNPIVAVFLGWALAGERLTARSMIASSVVLLSVAMIITSRKSAANSRKFEVAPLPASPMPIAEGSAD
jgi:drug/metabolite transporter (DMT)-like permease